MRRRPWSLVILAFFHILAPIGNIIFNAIITNHKVLDYLALATTNAYLSKNWPVIVFPLIAGVSIYACKRWSFYVYLVSITILFAFSYGGFLSKSESISLFHLILVYLINVAVVVYFLIPAVRSIYFDRRMRWWEIKPRYTCDFPAEWQFDDNDVVMPGEIGNISINGLFIKSEILPKDDHMVTIRIPQKDGIGGSFYGQVILHNTAKKIGFGVKFHHDKESKQLAEQITGFLDSNGMRITTLDIRPEDSFTYWARTLITTGKGLLPNTRK